MAEDHSFNCGLGGGTEKEKSDTNEMRRPKNLWASRSNPSKVAAVRPVPRESEPHTAPSSLPAADRSSHLSPRAAVISPPFFRNTMTRLQPFTFDERDSIRREARERRLEELRQLEERCQALNATFKANPIRRYKPLLPKQNTRSWAVPEDSFSDQE